ncbi:hydroxymethylbilane synthase [Calidithermus roseus]|uniref:Hydroxymethylbilane synthase n=1 Tax=Calidithermus roseus TaxID=1644118 RepID=A0A399EDL5_9DEIN|nr:hydroxymethylbilane synthase [Calidithermus roseus]RIH82734.1 Porphobilinogen deaminase [Calidithermus roseus]
MRVIVIGTRGSLLAQAQTRYVVELLKENWPEAEFKVRTVQAKVGQDATAAELRQALQNRQIDIALHSMKYLPADTPEDLHLVAVTRRMEPREAFLGRSAKRLEDLPKGAVVGASTLCRKAQLLAFRSDLQVRALSGDLDDRLAALGSGDYDAIVMGAAELLRMDLHNRIDQMLSPEVILPPAGQGALGLEVRRGDDWAEELAYSLNHRPSADRVYAERAFVKALGMGLAAPAGALATVEDDGLLRLEGVVVSPDGRELIRAEIEGDASEAEELGDELAVDLLEQGGRELLAGVEVSG